MVVPANRAPGTSGGGCGSSPDGSCSTAGVLVRGPVTAAGGSVRAGVGAAEVAAVDSGGAALDRAAEVEASALGVEGTAADPAVA